MQSYDQQFSSQQRKVSDYGVEGSKAKISKYVSNMINSHKQNTPKWDPSRRQESQAMADISMSSATNITNNAA